MRCVCRYFSPKVQDDIDCIRLNSFMKNGAGIQDIRLSSAVIYYSYAIICQDYQFLAEVYAD